MKFKKLLALALAGLSVFSVAAGCGGSEESGGKSFSGGASELRYRVSNDAVSMVWINKIVDDFNETIKDKNCKIKVETTGNEYYQSLDTDFASKKAPDIVLMEVGTIASYVKEGYLLSLDSYIDKAGGVEKNDLWDLNSFFKYSKAGGIGATDGNYYALIKDWSPDFMLIYNKTMINEWNAAHPSDQISISDTVPLTWDEYYEIAKKMNGNGVSGSSMDFVPYKHLMEYIQMTGEKTFKNDGNLLNLNISGGNIEHNGVYKAFEYFCKLQYGNDAPAKYTTATTEGSGMERFKNQTVWSVWNGLYAFPQYELYDVDFEIGIAPPPVYSGTRAYAATSAMIGHSINVACKNPEIAYEFIEYYMTEGTKYYVGNGYNIPGLKSVASSDSFLDPSNVKMKAYTNYFYNFVTSANTDLEALYFSPNLSYNRMATLMSISLNKYFGNKLGFDDMLKDLYNGIQEELEEW